MKQFKLLIYVQLTLSIIAGILISKMSFWGRLGISIAYKEYTIFKSWWKTAIVLAIIQLLLTFLQKYVHVKLPSNKAKMFSSLLLIVAIAGLFGTFQDFTSRFSHKILKEKFHLGFYLFWLTWMMGNIYFIITKKEEMPTLNNLDN